MIKIIALIALSLAGTNVFACGVKTPNYVTLAISTVEEKIFSYGIKSIDENLPITVVSNCRETAAKRRFVMITFGPDVIGKTDAIRGTNFDQVFIENTKCSIKNNPLANIQSSASLKKSFESQWKFINECVEVQVTEMGPRPLSYPLDQTGCKITKVGTQSVSFSGGFCFFKPSGDSEYNVVTTVKDSCKKTSGYKNLGVDLQDLSAGVNFYTSSTYKDEINDLSAIGTFSVRLSTNPVDSLFKASEDFGILRPTFPADYVVNDIHLGEITISDQGDPASLFLKTPLIVNNVCKSVEKNGLKSSACDYSTPYIGEMKLINSKGQVQSTWYDGGIASPQWQGILNGEGVQISRELLKINESYKIEIVFSDPYFDFNTFKKRIKSKMQEFNTDLPPFYASQGISEIPDVGSIDDINPMIDVSGIGDVTFPSTIGGLTQSRQRLGAFFSTTMYPPMYSKACRPDTGVCEQVGKAFVKFTATFKVGGDYSISDLEVERVSKMLGSYKRKITEQPEYSCK